MSTAEVVGLVAALVVAAVLKLDYQRAFEEIEPLADAPYGDSAAYLDEAEEHFRAGARAAFYKPPLYSAFLHACDASTREGRVLVRRIQLILGLGTCALVYALARRRGGAVAAMIALLVFLLHRPSTYYETKLLDAAPSLFLTTTAALLLDVAIDRRSDRLAAATGFALGVGALVRASSLALTAVIAGALAFRRPRLAWFVVATAAVVVAPVAIHNYEASGDVILTNYSEGHTFLVGNNEKCAGLYCLPAGYPDGVPNERLVEQEQARLALGRDPSPGEQRNHSYSRGIAFIAADPARYARLLGNKLRLLVSSWEVGDNDLPSREVDRFGLLALAVVPFPLLLTLGLAGLWIRTGRPALPLAAPALTSLAALLVFYVSERYRVAATPFLAAAAGVLLARPVRLFETPRRGAAALACAALPLAVTLLVPMPVGESERRQSEAFFDAILDAHAADVRLNAGDAAGATEVLARGIAAHPGTVILEQRLAFVLGRSTAVDFDALAAAAQQAAPESARVAAITAAARVGR